MLNSMMKWQNPGITYFGGSSGGTTSGGTPVTSETMPSGGAFDAALGASTFTHEALLPGQTFNSSEELQAALAAKEAADLAASVQAEQEAAVVTGAQEQTDTITADPSGSLSSANTNIANYESQIANLTSQLEANPGVQTEIDRLAELLRQEQAIASQAQSVSNVALQEGQRNLATNAITDPGSLVQQAEVATTTVTPDQLIEAGTGQVGEAATATATTVDQAATAETSPTLDAATMDAATVSDQVAGVVDGMEAATATASSDATVRGQLETLMGDFEGGETPVWASGPMREAMQMMQARGMGASSIAGAAVVQAAMESAISIASQDAQTNAQFEMANLNNEQQTMIFGTQQRIAGFFSDQASVNAAAQFNATSENQTNQFFSNLQQQSAQFNAAQINATMQFNAGQENAVSQFNASVQNQRDQFNAQNSLVVSQANAQWRQSIATAETQAQNMANMEYAKNTNAITGASLEQLWQRERDLMDFAFQSSESSADRANALVIQRLAISGAAEAAAIIADAQTDSEWASLLSLGGEILLDKWL